MSEEMIDGRAGMMIETVTSRPEFGEGATTEELVASGAYVDWILLPQGRLVVVGVALEGDQLCAYLTIDQARTFATGLMAMADCAETYAEVRK